MEVVDPELAAAFAVLAERYHATAQTRHSANHPTNDPHWAS